MINEMSVVGRVRAMCGGDAADEARKHVKAANKALRSLRRAQVDDGYARIRSLQKRFLHSHAAKLCGVALSIGFETNRDWVEINELAAHLDPFSEPGEPVNAWAKIKSLKGDWRAICKFGPSRQACQWLIAFMLDARFGTHPLDFMARGRGADATVDQIRKFVDEDCEWFVLADIENCFGSVNVEKAAELLRLPQSVISHCLMITEEVPLVLPTYTPTELSSLAFSEAVRMGMPQGALPANRVMAQLLGPEIEALSHFQRGLFYGDDISLAVSSRRKAEAAAEALHEMLASHPAGPFRLKRLDIKSIREGFDFAKYHFRLNSLDEHMSVRPSSKSYRRFREKVIEIIRDEPTHCVYERVLTYRARWLGAFPQYERVPVQEEQSLILLWQFVISTLRPVYRRKWERACEVFQDSGKPAPGTAEDWLDTGKPSLLIEV